MNDLDLCLEVVDVMSTIIVLGLAPWYFGPFTRVADLPSRRSLRSVGTNRLVGPSAEHQLTVSGGPRLSSSSSATYDI